MTKKDYITLAEALNRALAVSRDESVDVKSGVRLAATLIASALQAENPRFDRGRFMKAVNQ